MDIDAAAILDANYKAPDGSSITNFGQPDKPVDVTQISGSDITAFVKQKYGTDIIALLEQGPSCQDYSPINKGGDAGRRGLMLMALTLIEEALPEYDRQNLVYEKEDLLIDGQGKYHGYNFYKVAGIDVGVKGKGEGENESKPVDIKGLMP